MAKIIAVANQKGGVSKTTTRANLGIGLAREGKKVLVVDSDPQGTLTISLGNPQPDRLPVTLATVKRIYSNPDLRGVKPPEEPQADVDASILIKQLRKSPDLAAALAGLISTKVS